MLETAIKTALAVDERTARLALTLAGLLDRVDPDLARLASQIHMDAVTSAEGLAKAVGLKIQID